MDPAAEDLEELLFGSDDEVAIAEDPAVELPADEAVVAADQGADVGIVVADEAPALGVDMYRTRTVGGIRFHRDVFEHATDPTRSHARLIVHCELHPLCSKRRGIGWRQQTPLGHWQPFAWLGAWHARAAEFASQSEHVQFAPTLAEQRDWKERNAEP